MRILDDNGYEYRTNAPIEPSVSLEHNIDRKGYFNFNTLGGVILSDIIGIAYEDVDDGGLHARAVAHEGVLRLALRLALQFGT